jgi:hypothetical protein
MLNNEITKLHALIQELEAIGAWGLAQAFRNQLNEITKEIK